MEKNNLALAEEITTSIPEKVERQKAKVFNIQSEIKKENKVEKAIYIGIKRTIDVIGSLVGMVLLVPATIAIYIARKVLKEDDGPIFYTQLRIGKNGKQFKLYKFRSMCMNADEKLAEYLEKNEEAANEFKKYKKLKHDPRITKLGNVLRKTSLDEMPQFINVLKGDMSLVGPRPYLCREKEEIPKEYYNEIIKVRPGITGYWQVNGRSDVYFEERNHMDTYYIEHRSCIMDLKIIIKTFLKVIKREGAI